MDNQAQYLKFEFKGNATDYFKIWIVNLFLTIITFGLYSPWAKVRRNQYLYGNSYFGHHSFEYTANPVRILIGRLIIFTAYLIFYITGEVLGMITISSLIALIFVLCIPFFVRQSIAFRQRYTRYHGLNFKHHASMGQYYVFFIVHFILIIITFGLILPYTMNKFNELIINNTSYGTSKFDYESATGAFYFAYFIKLGLSIIVLSISYLVLVILLVVIIVMINPTQFSNFDINNMGSSTIITLALLMVTLYSYIFATSLASKGLIEGWKGNIVYNRINLADYPMQNKWNAFYLAWIYFSNFFVILFSLGLLLPWTKIRLLKYKLENMGFAYFDFFAFEADVNADESALGEESADFFDFDIGF